MTEEIQAEPTAEQADVTAAAQADEQNKPVESPEATEGDAGKSPEEAAGEQKEASERTKRRREQRKNARQRRDQEAIMAAKEEAAYWRGKAENNGPAPVENAKPNSSDYEEYDDYTEALVKWNMEQSKPKTEQPTTAQPAAQPQADEGAVKLREAGVEKFGGDFEDMIEAAAAGEFAVTDNMYAVIEGSELGPEIAMNLYDNPEESVRIAKLPPYQQFQEMQRIETSVKTQPQTPASKAPPPVNTERSSSVPEKDMGKMPTADYIAMRNKQQSRE